MRLDVCMLFALMCLFLLSCQSDSLRRNHPSAGVHEPFDSTLTMPTSLRSVSGDLEVSYYKTKGNRIPLNEPFDLHVQIYQVPPRSARDVIVVLPLRDVQLAVDAAMPEHMHGMNVQPIVTQLKDGAFLVQGMLFHMPGRWELYFDVTKDGVTERAQTEINLE